MHFKPIAGYPGDNPQNSYRSEPIYDSTEDPRSFWWEPSTGALDFAGSFNPPTPTYNYMSFNGFFSERSLSSSIFDFLSNVALSNISGWTLMEIYEWDGFAFPVSLTQFHPQASDIVVYASKSISSVESYINYASGIVGFDLNTINTVQSESDTVLDFGPLVRRDAMFGDTHWSAFSADWINQQNIIATRFSLLTNAQLDELRFTSAGSAWTLREWFEKADNYHFEFTMQSLGGVKGGASYPNYALIAREYSSFINPESMKGLIFHEISHQMVGAKSYEMALNTMAYLASGSSRAFVFDSNLPEFWSNERNAGEIAIAVSQALGLTASFPPVSPIVPSP